jgi:hypothetical protein
MDLCGEDGRRVKIHARPFHEPTKTSGWATLQHLSILHPGAPELPINQPVLKYNGSFHLRLLLTDR